MITSAELPQFPSITEVTQHFMLVQVPVHDTSTEVLYKL